VLGLLENAEANAVAKGRDAAKLYVKRCVCEMAPKGRRRTYRAHGRIGPYMSTPAHIEIVVTEQSESVAKAADASVPKLHKRKAAVSGRVRVGGGI
jgi:large subunit ribosomal protein L17e